MFDWGFQELVMIALVALVVIGPERLPETLRTLGLWFGRMRRSFLTIKTEIEKEIGMDDIKRQLHNEAVMEEMKRIEQDVRAVKNDVDRDLNQAVTGNSIKPPAPDADPEPADLEPNTIEHSAPEAAEPTEPASNRNT